MFQTLLIGTIQKSCVSGNAIIQQCTVAIAFRLISFRCHLWPCRSVWGRLSLTCDLLPSQYWYNVYAAMRFLRMFSSLTASAANRRIPSDSLSVAIWSSFNIQRNFFSSMAVFSTPDTFFATTPPSTSSLLLSMLPGCEVTGRDEGDGLRLLLLWHPMLV